MPRSGQELLEETISISGKIADGLGAQNHAWENSVTEIIKRFGEVSGTFFFKTMPSVPATRSAQRDATALMELREKEDWDGFSPALEQLIKSAQNVLDKAGMKGTMLT